MSKLVYSILALLIVFSYGCASNNKTDLKKGGDMKIGLYASTILAENYDKMVDCI